MKYVRKKLENEIKKEHLDKMNIYLSKIEKLKKNKNER